MNKFRLAPDQLSRKCDPNKLGFKDTSELKTSRTIHGQPRGVRAIEFGVDIDSPGYNIYVLGPTGSDRVADVYQFTVDHAKALRTPDEWCYVHNFKQPHRPRALRLPPGMGQQLKKDMRTLIDTLRAQIPDAFESEVYLQARNQISNALDDRRQQRLSDIQRLATEKSFAIQSTPQGFTIVPVIDEKPVMPEEMESLPEETRTIVTKNRRLIEQAIENALLETRALQQEATESIDALRRQFVEAIVDENLYPLIKKYDLCGAAILYFHDLREDILSSLDMFENPDEEEQPDPSNPMAQIKVDRFQRYKVNVLVEHKPNSGAPVIYLDLPSYQNLIGRIEHEVRFGVMTTDFTQIKAGALHRANGGFLIMRAKDILVKPFAWEALKRALNTRQVVIGDADFSSMTVMTTQTLEPEPIPLQIKVILVGSQSLYYDLYEIEEDFRDLFRVKADFGDAMLRNGQGEAHYASFIANRCEEENLPHFSAEAVARVVEYGSWLISDQRRLSTDFGQIAPLIREAAFYARREKHRLVTKEDVQNAINERTYRNNEIEELSQERIADGTIFIDLDGEVIGQVNGLVVISVGDHTFGLPSRITARVYMGRDNVVQIDRESEMTGPIHDKGMLTLLGYLGGRYAEDYPLTLSASIAFEQNYGGVEGDSASSTELYSLLSALSRYPIRQDIAVTGSVNQHGYIQPIGSVTQKVEGFYNTCKTRGLNGTQGVIIPFANIPELMLNDEVIEAVKAGKFHVYAIKTVDEGMELLTGKTPQEVHESVDKRLRELAENLAHFEDSSSDEDGSK